MTLWLLAVTPHLLPGYNQVHDHFRAHRALAGAGRSLYRQVALVQRLDQPAGRILRVIDHPPVSGAPSA